MPADEEKILLVENVSKRIGRREIVTDLTFDVGHGEIYGFLGPNGAGKTTTIRMLVGLIRPTRGTVRIGGYDLRKEPLQALRHVGCIVENPEMYPYLTGRENLEILGRMNEEITPERIGEVVRLVELERRIDDRVKTYSLGMRQRLGIAQALLGKPKLLILDEPTNGLDPSGIREMRHFIRQ
ncbi:bacitracin transport ATP binding cassette transporter, ABC protein, partial [Desmospora sp. 8437]